MSDNFVDKWPDLGGREWAQPEQVLGQTIVAAVRDEYTLNLHLSNGVVIKVVGHTYDGCSLSVELEETS